MNELNGHDEVVHSSGSKWYGCLIPNCQARARGYNREVTFQEHKEKWHGPYHCKFPGCSRGPGHGFKEQVILDSHVEVTRHEGNTAKSRYRR